MRERECGKGEAIVAQNKVEDIGIVGDINRRQIVVAQINVLQFRVFGDINLVQIVAARKEVEQLRIVRKIDRIQFSITIEITLVGAIELLQQGVSTQVDVFDTRFADVEDAKFGIFGYIEGFHIGYINRQAHQFRASRGVERCEGFIGISAKGNEQRIVGEVERRVHFGGLPHFQNSKVGVIGTNLQRRHIVGVVVHIHINQIGECAQIQCFQIIVRGFKELQFSEFAKFNVAHIASIDVDVLNVFGITIDTDFVGSGHITSDDGSGVGIVFFIVNGTHQFMFFFTGTAVHVNPIAFGKTANHDVGAIGGTHLLVELSFDGDDRLLVLCHGSSEAKHRQQSHSEGFSPILKF